MIDPASITAGTRIFLTSSRITVRILPVLQSKNFILSVIPLPALFSWKIFTTCSSTMALAMENSKSALLSCRV
jgi:hypothetical protein